MNTTSYVGFARLLRSETPIGPPSEWTLLKSAAREPRASGVTAAFLDAHDEVSRLETSFADAVPGLVSALVRLDPAYQQAHRELRVHVPELPPVQSLTGSVPEPDAMLAVAEVGAMLALHQQERWARRHLDGPLGHLSPAITAALEQLPSRAHAIEEARLARARTFGVAHEAYTTLLARRGQLDATWLLQSAAATSWTDSVVKVWCDDLDERGSGVFIRPNLLVTAAHVISTIATPPDAARVHLEIPSHGSSRLTAIEVSAFDATQDYALLVVPRVSTLGVAARFDFDPPDGFEVSRFGYPVDGGPSGGTGHISRIGELFYTSDLHVPAGASGGALAASLSGGVRLVGIGTNDGSGEWPAGIPVPSSFG